MTTRPAAPFPIVAWAARRTRLQRRLALLAAVLVAVAMGARLLAGLILDKWWFDTVAGSQVWATKLRAQTSLAVMAAVVATLALAGSALVALRTRPATGNAPNRVVQRYRQRMGAAHAWVLVGGAAYVAFRSSALAIGQWQPWLLFQRGPSLGVHAPHIGWDLGYHLFRLPFLEWASGWLRRIVLAAFGFAVFGHIAGGAIKIPREGRRSSRRAMWHLGVLVASFAVLQALDYIFVRWPANATNRFGAFDGPGFTELRFVVPSLWLLAAAAMVAAGLTLWGLRAGRWRPPAVALALWGVLHVLLMGVVPAVVDRVAVAPAEAARQLPYIASNLEATRAAYNLDGVESTTETFADGLSEAPQAEERAVLDTIPVFTETQLVSALQVLQGTTATRITDVDLDRYEIDGVTRPVLIAARNANRSDLPESGWVQLHLVYTHGDGTVAVPADSTSPDGRPDADAIAGDIDPARPQLYFGENLGGWYAIVGTRRTEVGGVPFEATTGIRLSSWWRRLVLALAVREIEPLVSAELDSNAQLLYRRDVGERLRALAPFLSFDGNAYPVVADGGVTWIVDGYTKADTYPYSQFARSVRLPAKSDLSGTDFNYMHASVKATVDAYDGSVHLYRTEVGAADDPILDAWSAIFPGLIEPIGGMSTSLRRHLLYPPDMLTVQTAMLGRYHVSDAETLFNGSDSWAISAAAGDGVARTSSSPEADSAVPAKPVSLFMPGSGPRGGHWVAIRPFGPGSSQNPTSTREELSAFAIADHDDPEHLTLVRIDVDSDRLVSSPKVAQAAIDTDRDLAALFTLLNANGSAVQFGPMTLIPLDGAVVWGRSVIVTGTANTTAPRLHGVVAVSNGLVGEAGTLGEALDRAVRASPPS